MPVSKLYSQSNPNLKDFAISHTHTVFSNAFFISATLATGASLYKENTDWYSDGKYKTITVPTKTLDNCDYFNGESIDLIKIDVQGAELDILNGGEKTIKNTKYVLSEVSLVEYNEGAPLIGDVIDKMKEYGFNMLDIIEYHSFPTLYKGAIFQIDILFENSRFLKTNNKSLPL